MAAVMGLGRDFLPPINEGGVQVNFLLPPGTSLDASGAIAALVDDRIGRIRGVANFSRRTGRAELNEHAEEVNASEIIVSFDPKAGRTREEVLEELREELAQVPGGGRVGRAATRPPHQPHALRRQGTGGHQPGPHATPLRKMVRLCLKTV